MSTVGAPRCCGDRMTHIAYGMPDTTLLEPDPVRLVRSMAEFAKEGEQRALEYRAGSLEGLHEMRMQIGDELAATTVRPRRGAGWSPGYGDGRAAESHSRPPGARPASSSGSPATRSRSTGDRSRAAH